MSERVKAFATLPSGAESNPISILQAVSDVIGGIETAAEREGLKPVWDRLTLEIETADEEEITFARMPRPFRRLRASTIAVHPKEVSA